MRICHVCSNYDKFFINLMETQISRGAELKVFYPRAIERGLPDPTSSYVDVRLNYSNWHRPFFYLKENNMLKDFFNIYKKGQFNLIHAHTLFSNGYIALKAKKMWGTPYIVAVRNVDINIFFKYRLCLRNLGIEILKEADKIIFLSPAYKETIISRYTPEHMRKNFSDKSLIITNGIDKYFLENKYSTRVINREKPVKIITVGHVCKNKNQLTVCKAIEQLNNLGIKVDYTIVGRVLEEKVFKKIQKYKFVNYIPFLSKEELIIEYRKADIYVMPSLTETFGLTYAEAMSQGLPIIYSEGQGFYGHFNEGEVGYSVQSASAEDIANRVIDIIDNYEVLAKSCPEKVDKFNWDKITDKYIELYNHLIS